jgi:serine/threonine-protein kinase PpkA
MGLSSWTRIVGIAACCWLLPSGLALAQTAPPKSPLLIEGKKTLFQRVLTRPGTRVSPAPGAPGANALPPLTALYVYGRQQSGTENWLEVGSDSAGKTIGFLREADTVAWRHTMTLAFTNPANRDPVLFLKDRDATVQLLENPVQIPQLAILAHENKLPKDTSVVSVEPKTFIDLQKQFYLLPILEANTAVLASGFKVRTVRVASVTKNPTIASGTESQRVNLNEAMAQFRSAVVFVVDASSSMQPYIDRTRQAMDTVFKEVEANKLNDRVRFGMIAYRDDPAKTPGMEYLAKTFADPNKVNDRKSFFDAVAGVSASKQSTRAFAEDGFAGLDQAIRKIDWSGFGGRYIVLITDASSREGASPLASTGLSAEQMRQLSQENRIAIYALHLQTAEGKTDHARAKAQYERLTKFENVGSLYFPVEAGDAEKFHAQVRHLAELLVAQVKTSHATPTNAKPATAGDTMAKATEEVGHAMRLAYLGQVQGAAVPPLFEAWAADRDPRKPDIASFSVRALLTKNQLSDLQATLRRVVEAGEKGQIDPSNFFNQLRSAAAAMGRDPARVGSTQARNLEELGLMGEYLDGLPYQSKLMSLDQDGWARMSVGQQQALIDEIKSKIALYQRFHDDVDRWVQLASGGAPGDAVYPVPLDSLP